VETPVTPTVLPVVWSGTDGIDLVNRNQFGKRWSKCSSRGHRSNGGGWNPPHATSWQHKAGGALSRSTGNPMYGQAGRWIGRADAGALLYGKASMTME